MRECVLPFYASDRQIDFAWHCVTEWNQIIKWQTWSIQSCSSKKILLYTHYWSPYKYACEMWWKSYESIFIRWCYGYDLYVWADSKRSAGITIYSSEISNYQIIEMNFITIIRAGKYGCTSAWTWKSPDCPCEPLSQEGWKQIMNRRAFALLTSLHFITLGPFGKLYLFCRQDRQIHTILLRLLWWQLKIF